MENLNVRRRVVLAMLWVAALPRTATAAPVDPIVGTWAAADEDGDVNALVAITEKGGRFEGRIVKLYPSPGDPENPVCGKCAGPRKDAPVLGLTIIEGLRRQGDAYEGGRILDPDTGTEYQLKATLGDGGRTLTIRAFAGISLLGRTQVWRRQP